LFPTNLARQLGTAAPLAGEHKQVTVLFCDIANSMALAEELGPEQMHAVVNDFFALALAQVRTYEGTINQFLGDGFMALFGAPIAREAHEQLAMLAALAIRRSVAERGPDAPGLLLRMGINTGPVVVGKVGDSQRMDYTAVGDTTNLAARLQQAADPDTILVSEAAASCADDSVILDAMRHVVVKGRHEPITVYRLVGRKCSRPGQSDRGRRSASPFVGRDDELAVLGRTLAEARSGRGQVVAIVGDPGVGKSRLVAEARGLAGSDVIFLEGQCFSYGALVPYLPIVGLLRGLGDVAEGDPSDLVADRVRAVVVAAGLDVEGTMPYLLRLLGATTVGDARDVLSAETLKARTLDVLVRLVVGTSERRPVVVILENVHWIDRISEEFLTALVDAVAGARITILLTYRTGYRPRWRETARAIQIELPPLRHEHGLMILRAVATSRLLTDDVANTILERAEGNPFFVEELTRVVADHDDLRAGSDLPKTVQEVLMARIDRLSPEAKRVLQVAAVLGRTVPLRLLREMEDQKPVLERAVRELMRAELFYSRVEDEDIVYVFKHALVQEVAYSSLLTAHRRALHARAAENLERLCARHLDQVYDRLAFHYSRSQAADKAVEYLERLADRAARWYAHAEAVEALREAMTHVDQIADPTTHDRLRLRLALRQAHSLHFLGRFTETLDLLRPYEATVQTLDDDALAGEFYVRLGRTYDVIGDHARAVDSAHRALAAAGRCGDDAIAGKAQFVLAYVGYWSGHPRLGVVHGRRAVALLEQGDGDPWWLGHAYWVVGINHIILGEFPEALAAEARAGELADRIDDRRLQSSVAWSTGAVHALAGAWDAALEACTRGLALSPDPLGRAVTRGVLGAVYVEKGDHASALPLLDASVRDLERFKLCQTQGWLMALLAQAYVLAGDVERARALAQAGLDMTVALKYRYGTACAHRALARVAEARGELAAAEAHHCDALALFTAIEARYEQARTHLYLAELAATRGQPDVLRAELESVQRLGAGLPLARYADRLARLGETARANVRGDRCCDSTP
jgi:class 3 adenylate cyclase/tetratricopeptide (TPR) repeat protein